MVRDAGRKILAGIEDIPRLSVTHTPDIPVFEFTAPDGSIAAIGAGMDARGWHLDRQQGGLHLMLSAGHLEVADQFLLDLRAVVDETPAGGDGALDASYGGIA